MAIIWKFPAYQVKIPLPGIKPVIFAGPAVGFKLKEKYELNGEEIPLEEKILKIMIMELSSGAGLDIGRHFMIDVRYSLGLQENHNSCGRRKHHRT